MSLVLWWLQFWSCASSLSMADEGIQDGIKIQVVEDSGATGEVAQVYDEWRAKSGRQQMPGILKCFSHRPDFLRQVMSFSDTVHFSEGHLTRRTKEAIASWVSWLNRCPY
jgi:alkylhydroperoxidase family enzyme